MIFPRDNDGGREIATRHEGRLVESAWSWWLPISLLAAANMALVLLSTHLYGAGLWWDSYEYLRNADTVNAGSAFVATNQLPRRLQRVAPEYPVVQGVKPEFRLLLGFLPQFPSQTGEFLRKRISLAVFHREGVLIFRVGTFVQAALLSF